MFTFTGFGRPSKRTPGDRYICTPFAGSGIASRCRTRSGFKEALYHLRTVDDALHWRRVPDFQGGEEGGEEGDPGASNLVRDHLIARSLRTQPG